MRRSIRYLPALIQTVPAFAASRFQQSIQRSQVRPSVGLMHAKDAQRKIATRLHII